MSWSSLSWWSLCNLSGLQSLTRWSCLEQCHSRRALSRPRLPSGESGFSPLADGIQKKCSLADLGLSHSQCMVGLCTRPLNGFSNRGICQLRRPGSCPAKLRRSEGESEHSHISINMYVLGEPLNMVFLPCGSPSNPNKGGTLTA